MSLVGSDYLHALNLVSLVGVPCWLVLVGSGYLHALKLVPCWFVSLVGAGWRLLVYLGACALLVNLYKYPRKILSLQLYEVKETFLKLLR